MTELKPWEADPYNSVTAISAAHAAARYQGDRNDPERRAARIEQARRDAAQRVAEGRLSVAEIDQERRHAEQEKQRLARLAREQAKAAEDSLTNGNLANPDEIPAPDPEPAEADEPDPPPAEVVEPETAESVQKSGLLAQFPDEFLDNFASIIEDGMANAERLRQEAERVRQEEETDGLERMNEEAAALPRSKAAKRGRKRIGAPAAYWGVAQGLIDDGYSVEHVRRVLLAGGVSIAERTIYHILADPDDYRLTRPAPDTNPPTSDTDPQIDQ